MRWNAAELSVVEPSEADVLGGQDMVSHGNFVAYYRVSTVRQGKSGLGLEAQRAAVREHLNGGNWQIVAEFTEVESGKHADRPKLAAAAIAMAAPAMTDARRPGNRIIPGYFGRLGLRRRGRNQLQVWRAIIANEGRIMTTKQILQYVFPGRAPRRQWLSDG